MEQPLRIGVIGLGHRWQKRYRPALLALSERFQVRAVCDPVRQRATMEGRRLGCRAVPGPTSLLENDEVEAALLLDSAWYGLWALQPACRVGKPIFCACPLEFDEVHADELLLQVANSRLPVMVEMAHRFAAATVRLRQLLEGELGPARLVVCSFIQPARERRSWEPASEAFRKLPGITVVDWCLSLLNAEPVRVLCGGSDVPGFINLLLELPSNRAIQVIRRYVPGARRVLALAVDAERGSASVRLPDRVRWNTSDGRHVHLLRGQRPLGQILLEQFHYALTSGRLLRPNLHDAHRILHWLRGAARSQAEGRRIEFANG